MEIIKKLMLTVILLGVIRKTKFSAIIRELISKERNFQQGM